MKAKVDELECEKVCSILLPYFLTCCQNDNIDSYNLKQRNIAKTLNTCNRNKDCLNVISSLSSRCNADFSVGDGEGFKFAEFGFCC